jgi:hypothetical protein
MDGVKPGMSGIPTRKPTVSSEERIPTGEEESNGFGSQMEGAKAVYRVVTSLKTLASAYPHLSKDIDEIINQVQALAKNVMSSGSPAGQPTPSIIPEEGGPGPY